jgi:hypothetical protein
MMEITTTMMVALQLASSRRATTAIPRLATQFALRFVEMD